MNQVLELVGLLLVMATIGVTSLRWVLGKISEVDESSRERDRHALEQLSQVRDTTVRKDDWHQHMNRIERGQEHLQEGIDRLHSRMDGWTKLDTHGSGNRQDRDK